VVEKRGVGGWKSIKGNGVYLLGEKNFDVNVGGKVHGTRKREVAGRARVGMPKIRRKRWKGVSLADEKTCTKK